MQGEVAIVVEGSSEVQQPFSEDAIRNAVVDATQIEGLSTSDAAKQVSKALGLPRRQVYQMALQLQSDAQKSSTAAL